MPKGGSGFLRGAGRAASTIQRGASREWRLANPGDYTKEITDLFKSMYRTGVVGVRNSRGELKEWGGSEAAFDRAMERINDLANRMAGNVQVYNREAAQTYSLLRQTWGSAVRVNAREMEEFRRGMQAGDRMLINPRGGRTASDAENLAREGGYASGRGNVDTLLMANRQLNATRNAIWQNASKTGSTGRYSGEIADQLWKRYEKTERAAWRRRKR